MKLFDSAGKEYEAVTQEEVDKKIQEATQAATTKAQEEFKTKENQLSKEAEDAKILAKKASDDLAAATNKDENYKQLREAKEQAEKRAEDAEKARDEIVKKAVEGVQSTFVTRYRDDMLNKLSKGDQVLKDKLLVHYEKTLSNMPATTDAEVSERVAAAYRLSVDNVNPGLLNQVVGTKPTGSGEAPKNSDVDPQVAAWGAEFGLTTDDIKKYTDKAKKNYINIIDSNK